MEPLASRTNLLKNSDSMEADNQKKNEAERWFRDLTQKRLRRGVFRSVPALIEAIQDYIDHHNDTDRGFVWTAKADAILEKVRRTRAASE